MNLVVSFWVVFQVDIEFVEVWFTALSEFLQGVAFVVVTFDYLRRGVHALGDDFEGHALVELPGHRPGPHLVWGPCRRTLAASLAVVPLAALLGLVVRTGPADTRRRREIGVGADNVAVHPAVLRSEQRFVAVVVASRQPIVGNIGVEDVGDREPEPTGRSPSWPFFNGIDLSGRWRKSR